MGLIVQKFGGTSVGSTEKIRNAAERVIAEREAGNDVVVVVSAMGKSTDVLVDLAKELTDEPSKREMDVAHDWRTSDHFVTGHGTASKRL